MKSRILYLARSLEIGGLERVITLLANNLDKERFEPYVCCIAVAGEMAEALEHKDRLFVIGNTGRINIHSLRYIVQLIKEHSIDLIHSHELSGLLYGYPAARSRRIPIIHTKHGYAGIDQEKKPIAWIGKRFSRSASEYVCVSRDLKTKVKREIGISDDKATVIYNGIETPPESENNNSKMKDNNADTVIGCVGRLSRVKNYELLISAFNELRDKYPHCRLEIVGGGESEKELSELVDRLSLSDRVILHGFKLDVSRYYNRFDIFALTSFYEGLSMSLLEAISRGKPCIVSDVGGNTEIIENDINGFVFESENMGNLISRLTDVIDNLDSEWMADIKRNALDTFQKKFTVRAMVEKHEELYSRHTGRR